MCLLLELPTGHHLRSGLLPYLTFRSTRRAEQGVPSAVEATVETSQMHLLCPIVGDKDSRQNHLNRSNIKASSDGVLLDKYPFAPSLLSMSPSATSGLFRMPPHRQNKKKPPPPPPDSHQKICASTARVIGATHGQDNWLPAISCVPIRGQCHQGTQDYLVSTEYYGVAGAAAACRKVRTRACLVRDIGSGWASSNLSTPSGVRKSLSACLFCFFIFSFLLLLLLLLCGVPNTETLTSLSLPIPISHGQAPRPRTRPCLTDLQSPTLSIGQDGIRNWG